MSDKNTPEPSTVAAQANSNEDAPQTDAEDGKDAQQQESLDKVILKKTKLIKLEEDYFGYFVDEAGIKHNIKRFTWTNHNCIRVQVITYGATITSIKLPSRKRIVDDIVMGFDNIAGYLYNDRMYMGATIGRVTNKIEKATFVLDGKQYWLSANDHSDHCNGGFKGLDKMIWSPHVQGTKVILSCMSSDLSEGYPGDVLIKIVFELTPQNEFIINMDAVTTKPTIINLSNLLYFNLGGHGAGPDELYKHIVSINANCYTPLQDNGLPSGEILNVIYSKNDFQIPKVLSKEMGIEPDDGFNEHFCVNRGVEQRLCFAARAVHPPTGRVLEIYTNQCGVHFSTANHFEYGVVDIPASPPPSPSHGKRVTISSEEKDDVFELIERLHTCVTETLSLDSKTNYSELKDLIRKLHGRKFSYGSSGIPAETLVSPEGYLLEEQGLPRIVHSQMENLTLNRMQVKYLEGMIDVATKRGSMQSYTEVEHIIRQLLEVAIQKNDLEMTTRHKSVEIKTETELRAEQLQKELEVTKSKEDSELERKGMTRMENKIPSDYKDKNKRMHGKNNAIYKRHGGMCFQSQNYPNAIYHKNFPPCELHPGETYKHTIVYKFWIQSGSPDKWLKQNFPAKKK